MGRTDDDKQVVAALHSFLDSMHLGLIYEDRHDTRCADLYFDRAKNIATDYNQPGAEEALGLLVQIIRRMRKKARKRRRPKSR